MDDSAKNEQKDQGQGDSRPEMDPDGRHGLALRAIKALEEAGYEARMAGGCVRDRLLGIPPKDYDVATTALPDEVCTIFKQKNLKVVPTGIDHGTVTVVMAGQGVEITSLRRDVSTDGRRATVAFGSTFEEDAQRRDFTFNAMFEDADGRVYDYFGGQEDLKHGRLCFVGKPKERIAEDYLRILRMFRFWSRFGFTPDEATLEACRQEVQGLKIVSQERITYEWTEILKGDHAVLPLEAMGRTGVLAAIIDLKEIPKPQLGILDALNISRKEERGPARMAVILRLHLGVDAKLSENFMQKLRLSRQFQQKALLHLNPVFDSLSKEAVVLLDRIDQWEDVGGSFLEILLPLWRVMFPDKDKALNELEKVEAQYGFRRRTKVPLDGQALISKCGIKPGPELGQLLVELKNRWRLGEWHSRDEGVKLAKRLINSKE